MFAALLPGIRDIRVPLATGVLWLIGLWAVLFPYIPTRETLSDFGQAVLDIGGSLGGATLLAAFSFVAYLLGTITMTAWPGSRFDRQLQKPNALSPSTSQSLLSLIGKTTNKFGSSEMHVTFLTTHLNPEIHARYPPAALYQGVVDQYLAEDAIVLSSNEGNGELHAHQLGRVLEEASHRAEKQVQASLPQIAVRLHAADRNLWNEYDRLKAESEFQLAIGAPLAFALFALTSQLTAWNLIASISALILGAGCFAFFTWSGGRKVQSVTDAVLQPLIAGRMTAPLLEELEILESRLPKEDWELE